MRIIMLTSKIASLTERDNILEDEVVTEVVECAVRHLKRNRTAGPDNLSPEHIKFCGSAFIRWL